ncbi:hypothetical protein [Vibrio sp. SCSIO 43136]|uniref:hypothetical protein n=1 Tax=Vibrio sp. SCSIO 43136 TaxID=2819101 RepID=UPI00207584D4|nr:hypothetical protein [Vibrio sp. SCSIO 43136]USD67354.1 hypothetical protein J4N39_22250 [Vibrio sp. SCSIO 43136]
MKRTVRFLIAPLIATASLVGCNTSQSDSKEREVSDSTQLSAETLALGITSVPPQLTHTYSKALKFDRYTKVTAPNGEAIHIVSQDGLSDNQIVRARSILQHYLKDYPGSMYGADKSEVANKMADNGAILLLLNGKDDGSNPAAELNGQPLYHDEIQVEGGDWYIQQNYEHRDASFEEILHLVHDTGIGIDQGGTAGALPAYQAQIRRAQVVALSNNLWGIGEENQAWIAELSEENSLTQEYLASVIDAYYGLWGAWSESNTHSMWGIYVAKTRAEISSEDRLGAELMDHKFFHPYLTYNARIDASFNGDFSLKYDSDKPYTHHSQYLKDVTLTGANNSNVIVNQYDNHITGNSGVNKVFFSGKASEYSITTSDDGQTTVVDGVDKRDGRNVLVGVEQLGFIDSVVSL